jgi:ABC-type uncharacterized transport system auxiliary subunit
MKTKPFLLLSTLASSLLTACSGMMDSAQPAKQTYMLMPLPGSPSTATVQQKPALAVSLGAVPGLDTDWIQRLGDDASLTRYANARWPDHLPEVLTSVIQRSLASSGRFSAVEQSSRATGDAWMLQLEVEKFYGLQGATGETTSVVTQVAASIECNNHGESFSVNDSVAVGSERLSSVVAAHQQGLNDVTQQLLKKIFEVCP